MFKRSKAQVSVGDGVISIDYARQRQPDLSLRWIMGAILVSFGLTWVAQDLAHSSGFRLLQSIASFFWSSMLLDGNVYKGQVWRVITYMFLHAGWMHLFFNSIGLLCFAAVTRRCFVGDGWVWVFFIGGIVGGLLQLQVTSEGLVGASGGIMSLWGATISATIRFRFVPVNERPCQSHVSLNSLLFWLAFQFAFEQRFANVGHWAHFGGLVAGLALGAFLRLNALPTLLASRREAVGFGAARMEGKNKNRSAKTVSWIVNPDIGTNGDFVIVEWKEINWRNRQEFSYELVAGRLPEDGIKEKDCKEMVELAGPYGLAALMKSQTAEGKEQDQGTE